jgi:hypothetical protein
MLICRGPILCAVAALSIGATDSVLAQGAARPNKTVELYVPSGPGGGYDIYVRTFARYLLGTCRVGRTTSSKTCLAQARPSLRTIFTMLHRKTAPRLGC